MDKLIELLLHLIEKVPYLNEEAHTAEMDLLREVEAALGVSGITPPKAVDANQPAPPPPVVDPGPVAEPVPPQEQVPPPTGTEAATADPTSPEATNAFSGTDPNAPPPN